MLLDVDDCSQAIYQVRMVVSVYGSDVDLMDEEWPLLG